MVIKKDKFPSVNENVLDTASNTMEQSSATQPPLGKIDRSEHLRKTAAKGLVDKLLSDHLSLAVSTKATLDELTKIEIKAREVCETAGFSDAETSEVMHRFAENKRGETISGTIEDLSEQTISSSNRYEPRDIFAADNPVENTVSEYESTNDSRPQPELGWRSRLNVWANSALLGRPREDAQKDEQARLLNREAEARKTKEAEFERERQTKASTWYSRAWNQFAFGVTPEEVERRAQEAREERFKRELDKPAKKKFLGIDVGRFFRNTTKLAVAGGILATANGLKNNQKADTAEAFANRDSVKTEARASADTARFVSADTLTRGGDTLSEGKHSEKTLAWNSSKKFATQDTVRNDTEKVQLLVDPRTLDEAFEDSVATASDSVEKIMYPKIDTVGKENMTPEVMERLKQTPIQWDWKGAEAEARRSGYDFSPFRTPNSYDVSVGERTGSFFIEDFELINVGGVQFTRKFYEQMDKNAVKELKDNPHALLVYVKNLEDNLIQKESVRTYTIDLLEKGEELAFRDGVLMWKTPILHGADDSLTAEQRLAQNATRLTPTGMKNVTLVDADYQKKYNLDLKPEGHGGFKYLFHIDGRSYKHEFIESDKGQAAAVKSENKNDRCRSGMCERQSSSSLDLLVKYMLPAEKNADGERSFTSYIFGKGESIDPVTGAVTNETNAEALKKLKILAEENRKKMLLEYRISKITVNTQGGDDEAKVESAREHGEVRAIRTIMRKNKTKNTYNQTIAHRPENKPQLPIGG
ncbi:MAG: hypothetical protein WCG55_03800 [bacterium]